VGAVNPPQHFYPIEIWDRTGTVRLEIELHSTISIALLLTYQGYDVRGQKVGLLPFLTIWGAPLKNVGVAKTPNPLF